MNTKAHSIWLKEPHTIHLGCPLSTRTEWNGSLHLRTRHGKSPGVQRRASKKKITEEPAEKSLRHSLAFAGIGRQGSLYL